MLMFQNGLLVTFIPEILMVLGYVLCLFTSGYKADNSTNDQISNIVIVASVEQAIVKNESIYIILVNIQRYNIQFKTCKILKKVNFFI